MASEQGERLSFIDEEIGTQEKDRMISGQRKDTQVKAKRTGRRQYEIISKRIQKSHIASVYSQLVSFRHTPALKEYVNSEGR